MSVAVPPQVVNDLVFSGSSDQCVYAHNIHVSLSVKTKTKQRRRPSRSADLQVGCPRLIFCLVPDGRAGPGLQGPQPRRHRGHHVGEGDGNSLSGQTGARLRSAGRSL